MHLGPFQGKVACTEIPFGKGVCGVAALHKQSQLVGDVHQFPGHIACDSQSRSELVVPLIYKGRVVGVLDIDSSKLSRFTVKDQRHLEKVCLFLVERLWRRENDKMELKVINQGFSVCKVKDVSALDFSNQFLFVGKTDEEFSVVCPSDKTPHNIIACEKGWRAFRIQGVLDFSLVGILSKLTSLLADNQIGIFALSTFNTDYVLIKEGNFCKALQVLRDAGYSIVE